MPAFFAGKRMEWLSDLFSFLDADGEGTLDSDEISPLLEYIISTQFGVDDVSEDDLEVLLKAIDEDASGGGRGLTVELMRLTEGVTP